MTTKLPKSQAPTPKKKPANFRFKSTDQIGANGAEEDHEFLEACFVDTGRLEIVQDFSDRRVILLGRTGAGKSALLSVLETREKGQVVKILPESLALSYVANSTILNFFAQLGVNLDPFFKLLWRHVLAVELLGRHFSDSAVSGATLIDRIKAYFSGATRSDRDAQQAAAYLAEYGKSFWQETEYRVKEITTTVESQLEAEFTAKLGTRGAALGSSASAAESLSETEKAELVKRGQEIVSKAQVQDLQKILNLLDKVLEDKQRRYYITIDGLDDGWVDEANMIVQLEAERSRLREEVSRLVGSIADGVPAASVAPEIKRREAEIAKLDVRLRQPRQAPVDLERLRLQVNERAEEWRETLRAEKEGGAGAAEAARATADAVESGRCPRAVHSTGPRRQTLRF